MHKISLTLFIVLSLCLSTVILPFSDAQEKIEWNRPIPFVGAQPTLVLMVDFTDVRFSSSIQRVEQIVKTLDNFIRTSSYGKSWLDYYIYPKVITLSKPMSYYGAPQSGAQRGDDTYKSLQFKVEIIRFIKEKSGVDITKYKHIIIIHAGGDEAISGSPNDIWSHCAQSKILFFLIEEYGFDTVEEYLRKEGYGEFAEIFMHKKPNGEGHLIAGIETVAENEVPSVLMHEFTHSMWIWDQYVYAKDGYSAGSEVGVWSNMDAGPFLDPPVDIDGWSKYLLGWIQAIEVSEDGEYIIHTLDNSDEPHGIIIPINDEEYYFIHARRPSSQDAALPGPGVLLFKVNKYRNRNVEGEPFMVHLYDANPETPSECSSLKRSKVRLCEGLDAPYYDEKGFRTNWNNFEINLLGTEVTTEEGYYIKVTEFDEAKGTAKVYISLKGKIETSVTTTETTEAEETVITKTVTGQYTDTMYTSVITYETITKSVVVTVTVKQRPQEENIMDYLPVMLIIIAIFIAFVMILRSRRPTPPPPPPPPSYF